MANAAKTKNGFAVYCPFCQDDESIISIELNDLGICRCDSCDEVFTPLQAVAKLGEQYERWRLVVRWVESATPLIAGTE
jgi:hypothetical protein